MQKKKKMLVVKYGLFVFLMARVLPVAAISEFQNNKTDSVKVKKSLSQPIYQNVDVLPQFPGGIQAFYTFIEKELISPRGAEGGVEVYFAVETDGTLSDFKVLRSTSDEMAEEALRVLKLSPKWKPGKLNGEKVKVSYNIPIMFRSNYSNPPYILLDGKEIKESQLKKIKRDDIESINVLRGKDATNNYGEKGKNGVIIVKLKKKD